MCRSPAMFGLKKAFPQQEQATPIAGGCCACAPGPPVRDTKSNPSPQSPTPRSTPNRRSPPRPPLSRVVHALTRGTPRANGYPGSTSTRPSLREPATPDRPKLNRFPQRSTRPLRPHPTPSRTVYPQHLTARQDGGQRPLPASRTDGRSPASWTACRRCLLSVYPSRTVRLRGFALTP